MRWGIAAGVLAAATGCSLLVESDQPTPENGQAPLPFSDDFEGGEPSESWRIRSEAGDTCGVVPDPDGTRGSVLQCATDSFGGGEAFVFVDVDPVVDLAVEMDVRFQTVPTQFHTFLQAFHVERGNPIRLLNSQYYFTRQVDLWNYNTNEFQYVSGVYDPGVWYTMQFALRVDEEVGTMSLSVEGEPVGTLPTQNTGARPISRVGVGLTLQSQPDDSNAILVDNVTISAP